MVRLERPLCPSGYIHDGRAHVTTVSAVPDVMKSPLSGSDGPGGRRPDAHAARRRSPQLAPHRDARQAAVLSSAASNERGRTRPFSASSEGHVDAESPVFMGIYRQLLGAHEQRKSGSSPEGPGFESRPRIWPPTRRKGLASSRTVPGRSGCQQLRSWPWFFSRAWRRTMRLPELGTGDRWGGATGSCRTTAATRSCPRPARLSTKHEPARSRLPRPSPVASVRPADIRTASHPQSPQAGTSRGVRSLSCLPARCRASRP